MLLLLPLVPMVYMPGVGGQTLQRQAERLTHRGMDETTAWGRVCFAQAGYNAGISLPLASLLWAIVSFRNDADVTKVLIWFLIFALCGWAIALHCSSPSCADLLSTAGRPTLA